MISFFIIVILAIFLSLFVIHQQEFEKKESKEEKNEVEEKEYQISYQEENSQYEIFKKGDSVTVKVEEQVVCIQAPCNPITYQHAIRFEKNKKEVLSFLEDLFSKTTDTHITITTNQLDDAQQRILEAIIYNDETYLEEPKKELYFTLQSARIDCPTVLLKVYRDNTYEYIYGSTRDGNLVSKEGTYAYPVSSFLEDSRNEEPNEIGPYRLTFASGEEKYLYDNTSDIQKFLEKIQIQLDTCSTVLENS